MHNLNNLNGGNAAIFGNTASKYSHKFPFPPSRKHSFAISIDHLSISDILLFKPSLLRTKLHSIKPKYNFTFYMRCYVSFFYMIIDLSNNSILAMLVIILRSGCKSNRSVFSSWKGCHWTQNEFLFQFMNQQTLSLIVKAYLNVIPLFRFSFDIKSLLFRGAFMVMMIGIMMVMCDVWCVAVFTFSILYYSFGRTRNSNLTFSILPVCEFISSLWCMS